MSGKRNAIRVSVLLGDEVMKEIDEIVEYSGTSRSSYIAQIVANHLRSQKMVKTSILDDPNKFEDILRTLTR